MMEAVLSNADHPEYGVATIPLPVPRNQYDHCVALLEALEIGDASEADCRLDSLDSAWPVLNRLVCTKVNLDELDYLAKRLDSFTKQETAQFQAMAVKLGTADIKDFINLSFCCQQATVITDFSDWEAIGRDHFLALNGGCAGTAEWETLDARNTALNLILNEHGTVTPYGVVYDNDMKLETLYDGRHLPAFHYDEDILAVGISSREEPEDTAEITWLYLPCTRLQLERGMQRSGIGDPDGMRFWYEDSALPPEAEEVLEFRQESLYELNELAATVKRLSPTEREKLGAVVTMAEPESAGQIRQLTENLDQFSFAPNAHTPAEYGKYMIRESGHFDYDENLEDFYDYERYGLQRMEQESGLFTDRGFISYHGTLSLEELMMEDSDWQNIQMGGM